MELTPVKVYLDNFIGVVQGGQTEQRQMTFHLFQLIYKLLCPNNQLIMSREEPILLKKISKGNAKWDNQKTVLIWTIDTVD